METNENQTQLDDLLKDLPTVSKVDIYKADEMIVCDKCSRNNPPTRLDCLYCGTDLNISEIQSSNLKPILRKIEAHEKGCNLIYLANLVDWDESNLIEVAKMTRFDKTLLRELVEMKKSLPLARTKLSKEVGIVSKRLEEMGIETIALEDEYFELEHPVKRLRGIDLSENKVKMRLFNTEDYIEFEATELCLVVVGALFERKIESTEQYKKRADNKILATAEISADEAIIDIYVKDDPIGYRISTKGFDFSCLGSEKQMLAAENINILSEKISRIHPNVKLDEDYLKLREFLTHIWELNERMDSKGLKRKGLSGFNRESIVTSNNQTQFTRYSRLQWYLNNEGK